MLRVKIAMKDPGTTSYRFPRGNTCFTNCFATIVQRFTSTSSPSPLNFGREVQIEINGYANFSGGGVEARCNNSEPEARWIDKVVQKKGETVSEIQSLESNSNSGNILILHDPK